MDEYKESDETREKKSDIAKERPRDEDGHFLSDEEIEEQKNQPTNPLSRFLHKETAVHKGTDDELIDIHIGNPLRRITDLLEQIKRQKAFSFTLKGSLGLMGVALVAGTFSILGGSKILCDKGVQTKIGEVRELTYKENSDLTLLHYIPFIESFLPDRRIPRKILVDNSGKVIHLVAKNDVDFLIAHSSNKILTGNFDSCADTLTVDQQTAVEQFFE